MLALLTVLGPILGSNAVVNITRDINILKQALVFMCLPFTIWVLLRPVMIYDWGNRYAYVDVEYGDDDGTMVANSLNDILFYRTFRHF